MCCYCPLTCLPDFESFTIEVGKHLIAAERHLRHPVERSKLLCMSLPKEIEVR
jgi:hypothetical protein